MYQKCMMEIYDAAANYYFNKRDVAMALYFEVIAGQLWYAEKSNG